MKLYRNLKISQKTLLAHRMRTLLALMGIIVGVSAVIIMTAIGNGAQNEVLSKIEAMGANLLIVNAGDVRRLAGRRNIRGTTTTLKLKDVEFLESQIEEITGAAPLQSKKMMVKFGNLSVNTTIAGTSPDFQRIRIFSPSLGRFFSDDENKVSLRVAVVGQAIVDNLFEGDNPIGETIRIGKIPFEVIGVMEAKGLDLNGVDQDDRIFIPIRTALRRVFNQTHLSAIYLQVNSAAKMTVAANQVSQALREGHRLNRHNKPDDFTVQNQADLLETQKETTDTFTALIVSIAAISLFVGGIGILAIMLLSIRERTNEIGLRMAVGAGRKEILIQFLFESSILSVGGGIIGVFIGFAVSLLIKYATNWAISISLSTSVISFGFSLLIGLFFGVYPAYKASLLDPITALRSE